MTEALITELGKVHTLRVISRQSVMHYKGTNKTVPQIAKELNVDALVEGSILQIQLSQETRRGFLQSLLDPRQWPNR
jgi:TolB-like protein